MVVTTTLLLMAVYVLLWTNARARLVLAISGIGTALGYAAWATIQSKRKRAEKSAGARSQSAPELDISRQDGTVRLPNGAIIDAGLSKDAFRASDLFRSVGNGNDGNSLWIHYRFLGGALAGRELRVSLCFFNQTLVYLELAADLYPPGPKSWSTYSLKTEATTKDFHDQLLHYLFDVSASRGPFQVAQLSEDESILARPVEFPFSWGTVSSSHDSRGGGTSITVSYGNRLAEALATLKNRTATRAASTSGGDLPVEQFASDAKAAAGLEAAKRALAQGKRAEAVRLARESTGLGLREAQDLVARWERKG
ncbi:MAG: hypothetical protein ACLPJH_00325 [Myxococcaceae bacterium]